MFHSLWLISPWMLIPYAIAIVMPTWRWLLGCTLLIGGLIVYAWVDHSLALQRPGYKDGPAGALGIVLFAAITMGFASGVVVRAASLVARAYGRPRTAFTICVLGVAVPFLVPAAPTAWRAWQMRPAPAECVAAGFQIELGGARLNVPAARLFTIYRGRSVRADAYYLESVRLLRELCGQTANGAQRVPATNLAIRFDRMHWGGESVCKPSVPAWAGKLCAAAEPIGPGRIDQTDFPITAYVFAPAEVTLGEFGGSVSTYRDSLGGSRPGRQDTFTTADAQTPDGNPLTFVCTPQSGGTHWCRASYLWSNGAHMHYSFRAPSDGNIAERGKKVDAALNEFLAQFRAAAN